MTCPVCTRENRADAQFCDACGAKLRATVPQAGERRQLTILFCDIVGYTSLSQILDEDEGLHEVVGAYRRTVSEVIVRWGGRVKDHRGDDVCAYFGYPQAHENDAERAVRAGLEIMRTLGSTDLRATPDASHRPSSLVVRIGIHTGPVTVAELGNDEPGTKQPLGPSLNVAARLQAIAAPGAIVVSDATKQLVAGLFSTEEMGALQLKGIPDPVRAHVVVESTDVRGRLDASLEYAAPLIGRERELTGLRGYWQQAQRGQGQVVLISGDAGIGKSRLVRRFTELVTDGDDGRAFEWRCSPFHTSTPFHPIVDSLEQHLGLERGTSRDQIGSRIHALLETSGLRLEDGSDLGQASGLISDMVSPGTLDSETLAHETPPVRRSRTLNVLCDLARAQARHHPSMMVVDDLHWVDPSTIELLGRLLERSSDVPLLLLLTFRPDFVPPWPAAEHVHTLALEPLAASQCAELFDALVGSHPVSATVRDELLSKADGVPLFLEELTRTVLGPARDGVVTTPTIPSTLRGLLASRLDRLSAGALETIHLASAFSREFPLELLANVSQKTREALRQDLEELVHADLVYPERARDGETYAFKHALIADAAYDSILRSDRRRLHQQIAHRLVEAVPAIATDQPELLAHHFGEAGETETAIEHWRRAGDAAISRGAYQEAVRHFDRGLELLAQLTSEHVRLHHEIALTESKGTALFSMLGYAHPEVEKTFAHASMLCERDGSSAPLRVLYGLWVAHTTRSNREAVEVLLPRFEDLARSGDPVALLTAHANAGVYAFFTGHFERCLTKMTEATRWYATSEHSAFLKRHGYGGGLYPFAWRMWSLSILGCADQAVLAEQELQTLAERAGNPYGLAIASGFRLNLARDRRDPKATLVLADHQIAYAQRQMLPFWEGPAHCSRGWARACLGEVADGVAEIALGLHYLDAVGLRATYGYQLGGLAEALLAAGDLTGALTAAERGLAMCDTTLDRFYEAELLRLEAECQRRLGDVASAESGFTRALSLARQQSAALFALRAGDSLARLFIEDGKSGRARQELESVLSGISEGLDMTEVASARQLLDSIA
jgi:class 3 adenylate cyclase